MKVEVLYSRGCPNHAPALDRVHAVLAAEGVTADVVEIEINDAAAAVSLGFPGSPTIRVNGIDIEAPLPMPRPSGLSCRTYVEGGAREGIPSISLIRSAINVARIGKRNPHEAF